MKKLNFFFFSFLVGLVLTFAAFVGVVNLCGRGIADQPWYLDLYPLKEHFAKEKKSPKIIIIGGSSSLMGIDGEKLQAYTGMDNINFSMSVMVPMRFYLVALDKYVKKGDVVVMPLEFGKHYNETEEELFSGFGISLLFGCDPAAQKTLKLSELCSLYFQYGLSWINTSLFHPQGPWGRATSPAAERAKIAEKQDVFGSVYREQYVVRQWKSLHNKRNKYNAPDYHYDLSPYGDWLVDHDPVPPIPMGGRIPAKITDEFVYSYQEIKKLVESRGATLLLVYTNRYSYAEDVGIDEFTAALKARGITICGRPESVAFPKYFYHEPLFHMNQHGAALWTYEMAKTICRETGRPMPKIADWPYVVFADDPAYHFPGVAASRIYESGVEIAQKEFPLVVNIPQSMRGKKLELSLIAKQPAGKRSVLASVRAGGQTLHWQESVYAERSEVLIRVPAHYTNGEKLELTCTVAGETIGMERLFIRPDTNNAFFATQDAQFFRFKSGFSEPEAWGRWTDGERAELAFKIPEQCRNKNVSLSMDMLAFVHPNKPTCKIAIEVNQRTVLEQEITQFNSKVLLSLTAAETANEWIDVGIKVYDPRSPKELGISEDTRRLGVGIQSISIAEAQKEFSAMRDARVFRFESGFAEPEPWGRWTDGERAEFSFRIPEQFRNQELTLTLGAQAFIHQNHPTCKFAIEANQRSVFEQTVNQFNNQLSLHLTAADTANEWVKFTIKVYNPRSPKECGASEDTRRLGVGIRFISITETNAADKK